MSSPGLRRLALRLTAGLPLNVMRVAVYRHAFKYSVGSGSRIGRRTVIDTVDARIGEDCVIEAGVEIRVASLHIEDRCRVSAHTRATGPIRLRIGADTSVGEGTAIFAGSWATSDLYALECVFGSNVAISANHSFDVVCGLYVGEGTWFAGRGTQVWTHGMGRNGPVRIGDYCYVASAVRIGPGVTIAPRTSVGMASVVVSDVEQSGCLVAGAPAEIKKRDYAPIRDWRSDPASL